MYVVVDHRISDPEQFWGKAKDATPHLPAGVTLHHTLPNADGTRCVCLWEADSVERVRNTVEPVVGQFSDNEYFEVNAATARGLPTGSG